MLKRTFSLATVSAAALACAPFSFAQETEALEILSSDGAALMATPLETFDSPWAMTFLPDGRALVTEMAGKIWLLNADGSKAGEITNVPVVTKRNQGGLGDIILHPDFAQNSTVFLSYVERDAEDDTLSGAAVEKAVLTLTEAGGALEDREVIWRQSQKFPGNGHYGMRLVIAPDGNLIITSSERQKFSPAQNMDMNLGKVIRVTTDGEPLEDNPFY